MTQLDSINRVLPVFKPVGMSSHHVVRIFKKQADYKGKIGHAGTLDVFASGLLLLLLGKATKQFDYWQTQTKTYVSGSRLGMASETLDVEGNLKVQSNVFSPSADQIRGVLPKFIGEIEQAVPTYSAAKFQGQPFYKYARQGKIIEKSKKVRIDKIELVACQYPLVTLEIQCGSGTYIRQLAWDIFQSLGIDSFLYHLTRTQVGEVNLAQAAPISHFNNQKWQDFLIDIKAS